MSKITSRKELLHPASRLLPSERDPYAEAQGNRKTTPRHLPTLFDRLCDDDPNNPVEDSESYAPDRTKMREIVLRDLALLLNTTDQSDLVDRDRFPSAADSTINYGIPALAGGYLSERKWMDIELMIRRAIKVFEPRLMPNSVSVKPLLKEDAGMHYNVLVFEISGLIQMLPYPLEFRVQSAVDLESSRIEFMQR